MTWDENTHRCWDTLRIPSLSTYDPTSPKSLFVAAHSPFPLKIRSSAQIEGEGTAITEIDFVNKFYSEPNPDGAALYSVLGETGTGKSQLIRLMYLSRDRANKDQHIVYLPKDKTDLRGALGKILDGLEGEQYERLRAELYTAVSHYNDPLEAETRFITELGLVLNFPSDFGGTQETAVDKTLREQLSKVISDTHFKTKACTSGTPKRIMARVMGTVPDDDDADTGLEFTNDEIKQIFDGGVVDKENLAAEARQVWDSVISRPMRDRVVTLLNRYVPVAINKVFLSNGTSLIELMSRLRLLLYSEGRELVLLIEDMSRLVGIQLEFFQALTTTVESENPTAPIRTIFAITPGFFNPLPDTVRQRISSVVEVQSIEDKTSPDLALAFFARYLNAARILKPSLDELDLGDEVPNSCSACSKVQDCHKEFGEVNGIGLYPFNRRSFDLLRKAMDGDQGQVPRSIVQTLFRVFLTNATQDLEIGQFPSERLLNGFRAPDGRIPSAETEVNLMRNFPDDGERLIRLQTYWAENSDVFTHLSPFFESAFRLPVTQKFSVDPPTPEPPAPLPDHQPHQPPTTPDRNRAFRQWAIDPLDMGTARDARKSIYIAVCTVLESTYGIRTDTTLISDKPGRLGTFLRPDSVMLPRSEGGADAGRSFAQFVIDDKPENRDIVEKLATGDYSDAIKFGETLAWIDNLAAKVHLVFSNRFADFASECAAIVLASQLKGNFSVPLSGLNTALTDLGDLESIIAGRSEPWRSKINLLLEKQKVAIERLEAVLGTGKRGGGTLSSRFMAFSQSKSVDDIILKETTSLQVLAKAEVENENNLKSQLRALVGSKSLSDSISLIGAQLNILDNQLRAQIIDVKTVQELRSTIQRLETFSDINLNEVDLDSPFKILIQSISAISPVTLGELESQIKNLITELDEVTESALSHAKERGFPSDLVSHVESQFANLGFKKDS